jgi:hypothetical protein
MPLAVRSAISITAESSKPTTSAPISPASPVTTQRVPIGTCRSVQVITSPEQRVTNP